MSLVSGNTSIVPYITPENAWDFIKREAEKVLFSKKLLCQHPMMFPFDSFYPYECADAKLTYENVCRMGKQLMAFYNHCKAFHDVDKDTLRPYDHNAILLRFNLQNKKIEWRTGNDDLIMMVGIEILLTSVNITPAIFEKQQWTFTFLTNNNASNKETYHLYNHRNIHLRSIPEPFFKGDELEQSFLPGPLSNAMIPEKEAWDTWKPNILFSQTIGTYRDIIYPLVKTAFLRICVSFNHREFSVMDLGGSDGELSLQLLDQCSHIKTIYLVDGSKKTIQTAQHRAQCDCPFHTPARHKLKPFQADLTNINLLEISKEQVDVILLCGVVAMGILTRKESKNLLKGCLGVLKDTGLIIITSYSSPHLDKPAYEELGYDVINMCVPFQHKGMQHPKIHPFYVLKKRIM